MPLEPNDRGLDVVEEDPNREAPKDRAANGFGAELEPLSLMSFFCSPKTNGFVGLVEAGDAFVIPPNEGPVEDFGADSSIDPNNDFEAEIPSFFLLSLSVMLLSSFFPNENPENLAGSFDFSPL